MEKLPSDEFNAILKETLSEKHATLWQILEKSPAALLDVRTRISAFSDVTTLFENGEFEFYFTSPTSDPAKLPWKGESREATKETLGKVHELLTTIDENVFTDSDSLKKQLEPLCTERGKGSVLWPLRYLLSGRERSPDPYTLMATLGKKETLLRLTHAINLL